MHLERMNCQGFRCLQHVEFRPHPGVNIIRGMNAQGKTSLLEAILFAATSKSHRTNLDSDLVRHGEEGFQITLEVRRDDRTTTLEATSWKNQKRVKLNGIPQTKMSDILGKVRVVFFSPEDIALTKGGAAVRRKFLDMELSQSSPTYLKALQNYRQVLRQRNELLRERAPENSLIDVWDKQLVTHGNVLIRERSAFIERLAVLASEAYGKIAPEDRLVIAYKPSVTEDTFLETLGSTHSSDLKRKLTGHGPHRDEVEITINDQPARSHASQGQQKSAALALKLAELELIYENTSEYPILMLDEVLAELDQNRSQQLFDAIDPKVQCLLTTTEEEDRITPLGKPTHSFRIHAGELEANGSGA